MNENSTIIPDTDLPTNVLAWGHSVRRPTQLPEHYDTRIDPADIYVLDYRSGTGPLREIYVTANTCDHCKNLRQWCSRSGSCSRCEQSGQICHTSNSGWTKLRGEKKTRPRKAENEGTVPHDDADPNSFASTPKSGSRAVKKTSKRKELETSLDYNIDSSSISTGPSSISKKGKGKEKAGLSSFLPFTTKKPTEFSNDEAHSAFPKACPLQLARRTASFGKFSSTLPSVKVAPLDLSWRYIKPPNEKKIKKENEDLHRSVVPQPLSDLRPRIWASTRTEMFNIFPEFSKSISKVFWLSSETPVLILEKNVWPEDTLNGKTVQISMVQEFVCRESDLEIQAPASLELTDPNESTPASLETPYCAVESTGTVNPEPQNRPTISFSTAPATHRTTVSALEDSGLAHYDSPVGDLLKWRPPTYNYADEDLPSLIQACTGIPTPSLSNIDGWKRDDTDAQIARGKKYSARKLLLPTTAPGPPVQSASNGSEISISISMDVDDILTSSRADDVTMDSPNTILPTFEAGISGSLMNEDSQNTNSDTSEMVVDTIPRPTSSIDSPQASRIPKAPPPEIQILAEAHKFGTPVVLIMSKYCPLLPFPLPSECGFAYLGYFFITELRSETIRSESSASNPPTTPVNFNGRVRWYFRLEWAPGGEQFLSKDDVKNTSHPWWLPPQDGSADALSECSPYQHWRDLDQEYFSFLPLDVVAQHDSIGKGWLCNGCGKLNEYIYFRHRICSHCKTVNNNDGLGYVDDLQNVRDPYNMSAMFMPVNIYPSCVDPIIDTWHDGMRTFSYPVNGSVCIKHVFTGNDPNLQDEPTVLFHDIQQHVKLRRQNTGTWASAGSYFAHFAGDGDVKGSDLVPWSDTPKCLSQAREFMAHRAGGYTELTPLVIDQLITLAWIPTGSKKGSTIRAKLSSVALLCLGGDIVIYVTPKIGFSAEQCSQPSVVDEARNYGAPDSGSDMSIETDSSMDQILEAGASTIAPQDTSGTAKPASVGISAKRKGAAASQSDNTVQITLIHGDILVLTGDDFEYSLARKNTSMLLIGSRAHASKESQT